MPKPLRSKEPPWRLLSPRFHYVPAAHQTVDHLREVFDRARNKIAREKALSELTEISQQLGLYDNVRRIK